MIDIILVSISAFLIVVFAIPSIITVAKLKGLYDKPDERKIHSNKYHFVYNPLPMSTSILD